MSRVEISLAQVRPPGGVAWRRGGAIPLVAMLAAAGLGLVGRGHFAGAEVVAGLPRASCPASSLPAHAGPSVQAGRRTYDARLQTELARIESENDPKRREALIGALLSGWGRGREDAGLAALMEGDDSRMAAEEVRARLVRSWAMADPSAAAQGVSALPGGSVRDGLLGHVGIVWANLDLAAASSWAQSLPDAEGRAAAVEAVAGEAVRTDALVALRLATAQPAGKARDELLRRAAMELAVDDPDALAKWAEAAPRGAARDQLLAGVALTWSEHDPSAAAMIAAGDLPEGRLQDDTLVSIAQRWGEHAPAQAAAWVEALPASEARFAAIENLAVTWNAHDPAAAAQWLDRLTHPAAAP